MIFEDVENQITCQIKLGKTDSNKLEDSLYGEIVEKGKVVSKIEGSFMSHINIDGVRFWDIRQNFPIKLIDSNYVLPSSSLLRKDRILLESNLVKEANEMKDKIEDIQRQDAKLRKHKK